MTLAELQRKECRLSEALLTALDTREAAREAESSLIVYLSDLLVERVRLELLDVRFAVEDKTGRSTPV